MLKKIRISEFSEWEHWNEVIVTKPAINDENDQNLIELPEEEK